MSANKTDKIKDCFLGIVIVFTIFILVISLIFANIHHFTIIQKIEYIIKALTASAMILVGIGLIIQAYYAAKRVEAMQRTAIATEKNVDIGLKHAKLTQERLNSERLMGAIAQLGNQKVEARTGAIYILERVAVECPKEYWTIMEIITAFIRENSPLKQQEKIENFEILLTNTANQQEELPRQKLPSLRTDIQAALTVLSRRDISRDPENQKLDLRNTNISWADLSGAKLQRVDLRGAEICGADLRGANLSEADLDSAKLSGANLYEANLQSSNLRFANLASANLSKAKLTGANLRGANLSNTTLAGANLCGANLYKANLSGANLKVANLCGAKLFLANLQSAKLGKANLQDTGLIGANLQQANLNGANLLRANLNAAKLQQTEVLFANLCEASLTEADLRQANLMGCNLTGATFYEANLCGANLMGTNLKSANLCDVKLEGAVLTGAKNLESEQINFAIGDPTTRLPEDLQVPAHWNS